MCCATGRNYTVRIITRFLDLSGRSSSAFAEDSQSAVFGAD